MEPSWEKMLGVRMRTMVVPGLGKGRGRPQGLVTIWSVPVVR